MKKPISDLRDHIKLLVHCSLLNNMNPLQRNAFVKLCHRREFRKDEFVFHKGDPASGLYFIEKGEVHLFLPDNEGSSVTLKPYQSFAEFSLTSEMRRLYSVQCTEDSILYGFYKSDFEVLKKRHPDIAICLYESIVALGTQLLELYSERLKEQTSLVDSMQCYFDLYQLQNEITQS
ncbi:cyclic nucleotide-binding domain-containing protein [bacterium]|nr:MAG: cyclic nucleotide-binding domain-containing protein [bacterium]